ncbi:hypothetical protein ACFQO1_03500 [Jejudonia soesokkakensis]|uniref:Uncharacterized protein n=1 Tax=Jejudonia soesokkakensis TaxID=1323432 RepID=A0ABW2MSD2_9FLAO
MKKLQNIVCFSLVVLLAGFSASAYTIAVISSENAELQENLQSLSAHQKVLFFIDTPGENSVSISDSEGTPVTFKDSSHYKVRIVAQHGIAATRLQQLTATNDPAVTVATIKERIFPFHSHW